jgi:ATP-dependent Lon protease
MIEIYDADAMRAAVGDGDARPAWHEIVDPDDVILAPPAQNRSTEDEVRARCLRRILSDPRGNARPGLTGSMAMARRIAAATATMAHFTEVTGIVERAVATSSRSGTASGARRPVVFPPILIVSPPGLGKGFYCRALAAAMSTTCVPIAMNAARDDGQLGGLSPAWRGARMGKFAKGLLIDSRTASPLFLLDEIDKPMATPASGKVLDVLLSALEPENARSFVDEYVDVPIDLSGSLFIASANDAGSLPGPVLSRMVVIEVPEPSREQSRVLVRSIAEVVLAAAALDAIDADAVEAMVGRSPRRMRIALDLACSYCAYDRRRTVSGADVGRALMLVERDCRPAVGFLPR